MREEVGLTSSTADWRPSTSCDRSPSRPGGIRFLFDCGVLSDAVLDSITLQVEELSEHRLVDAEEAIALLSGPLSRRVRAVLAAPGACLYLEDGRTV